MGKKKRYLCKSCGFEANLGTKQPYCIMSGTVTQKYCAKTGKIIYILQSIFNYSEISCMKEKRVDDSPHCKNCKGDCLQELEILELDYRDIETYKCPHCGGKLQWDHMTLIFAD